MESPSPELLAALQKLGLALGLGLLVGLQRERSGSQVAGIRTFGLLTVTGTLCGLLAQHFGGWIVGAGLIAVVVLMVVANAAKLVAGHRDPGVTTEVAALTMYGIGAYIAVGQPAVAVVSAAAVAVLLHLKQPLHEFIPRISERDFHAIMRFVLIALVILPVLPDRNYGPFEVLNPRNIWFMVVLIVGLNLLGYAAYLLFGTRTGTLLAGLLGGLISSTATTVSYSRHAVTAPKSAGWAALVVIIASAVSFARTLVEIAVVAPGNFTAMAPPLLVMLAWMLVVVVAAYVVLGRSKQSEKLTQANPAELRTALIFGSLYAGILPAVAAAKEYFGAAGLDVVAVVSGLTDMDAITLSTSRLVAGGKLDADTGWRLILLASLSNQAFKLGIVAYIARGPMLARAAVLFGAILAGGAALRLFWPAV